MSHRASILRGRPPKVHPPLQVNELVLEALSQACHPLLLQLLPSRQCLKHFFYLLIDFLLHLLLLLFDIMYF